MRRAAVIALLVAVLIGAADYLGAFSDLNGIVTNEWQKVLATRHESLAQRARKQIALVLLSDDSFDDPHFSKLSGPPLPRNYHARIIRELTKAKAKVIAFDFVFDRERAEDQELAAATREAARKGTRVLWACFVEGDPPRLLLPNDLLIEASQYIGHTGIPEGRTSVRLEPAIEWKNRAVPAFSFEAARLALGVEERPLRRGHSQWHSGFFAVPVDGDGTFKINLLGEPGEAFPAVPYEDIYNGAVDDEFYKRNDFFKDKIVLVGDTTLISHDLRATPRGQMFGVEINAHAVATLLQRGFIHEALPVHNLLALGILVALVALCIARLRLPIAALAIGVLLPAYVVFNAWLFVDHSYSLHLVAPLVAGVLTAVAIFAVRGLDEEREKRRMRSLFERSVSPQIADYIAAHPEKCVLGRGERVTATVLFSDIRGFTPLTEALSAEELIARLNEYFQVMTDIVFKHDGAAARFVGDAMMAYFGVPIPHQDHARRAVAAAIEMQNAIIDLQKRWAAEGLPFFDIGIGLNTGEMVAGIVGAEQRSDFTVHGPAVNIAARVEALNKQFNTRILITGETYRNVQSEVLVRGPLQASLKGVSESVSVYEVLGWKTKSEPARTEASIAMQSTLLDKAPV